MIRKFRSSLLFLVSLGLAAGATAGLAQDDPTVAASPMTGLDEAGVRAKLGEPALARTEGAGALWTYRMPTCALFVYFTDEGRGLRVTGAAAGPRRYGDPSPEAADCLAQAPPLPAAPLDPSAHAGPTPPVAVPPASAAPS